MSTESMGSVILNTLITDTSAVVEGMYGTLIGSWPGKTFVAVYVAVVGYRVLMGHVGEKSKEWAVSALLLVVISGIVGNYAVFDDWVLSPILNAAQAAGTRAAGGSGSGGALSSILDASEESLGKILTTIDRLEVPGNIVTSAWLYIKVGIVVGIMGLLACAQYLVMVALLCVAVFSLFMMAMVGGICVWLGAFKETRFVMWTWLKQTINYGLWIFFLGAASGIANTYIGKVADKLVKWDLEHDGVFTKVIGANMLLTALCIYMLLKAADWAAALTGGTSTNTGVIGAMGSAAGGVIGSGLNALGGPVGGALKTAGSHAAHAAGNAAYRAYSALRGLGKTQ